MTLTEQEILAWLREEDNVRLEELWKRADSVRRENVGEAVHLRGLVEISNICSRSCGYCGLRVDNHDVQRYRMTKGEILECAAMAVDFGYGTLVMQAGEDYGISQDWMADVIRSIKKNTPLAVTLSLGERPEEDLQVWKSVGADRYLLRFETSDSELFSRIHPTAPGKPFRDRKEILRELRELGYEVGSGVMIGIPGQTFSSLAHDIALFADLDLDMIGVGPFIAHPNTPLGHESASVPDQAPNTELMTYKAVALTRLVCPQSNIPSTTALATLNLSSGRELGLMRGANVVMPNLTPPKYRVLYEIYPAKACLRETAEECQGCLSRRVASIGRQLGTGPGGRQR